MKTLSSASPRILVVEDKADSRQLLTTVLTKAGLTVHEAVNGQEAFEQWRDWSPHLIWMDMNMPVMSGYETTKRIREQSGPEETTPVIIAISASAFEEDRERILACGCTDFVGKPFLESTIFEKMAVHLGLAFVHESKLAGVETKAKPTREEIADLPAPWRDEMSEALIELDVARINKLLVRIQPTHEHQHALMQVLVDRFAYDELLTTISSVK